MKKLYFNIVQTSVFGLLLLCVGALAFGQISTFPHSEGFEAAGLPPGWTNEHVTGTKDWDRVTNNGNSTVFPRTGAGMAEFRATSWDYATKLVTPQLDLTSLTVPQLTFYFANASWDSDIDELRIYYKAAAGDPWTQIGTTYDTEHISWEKVEITLPSPSADYYIAFEGKANYAHGVNIDDVQIREEPTCPETTLPTLDNFTSANADVSWTAGGTETAWNVSWGTPGFTPGDANQVGTDNVTSPSYQITGLTDNTSYDIYVQADCGAGDESFWAGPISITTIQTAVSLPYTDDFSSNNWVLGNGTQTNQWFVGGAEGNPANSLYITNDGGTTNEYPHTASTVHASKVFTLPAGSNPFNFSFQWKAGGESIYDYMRVWLIPATENPTPGTLITTANITGAVMLSPQYLNLETIWQTENYEIPSSHAGTDVKIVFEWRNDGFSGTTTGAAVDNISFTEITCPAPTSLLVDNFDVSTADISWTAGDSETDWNVSWGAPGFTPGDGNQVGTDNVTSTSYQITGLTENTSYDIFVQADCGGDESFWVGPISVTTLCLPYTVPYFEGFETGYAHDTEVEGCLSQESESGTQTWTANNTFTDYNRTPRTGDWNAFLRYSNTDWLFIPIHLDAGISYTFDMYARQDATSGASVSVSYGSSADVASMTEVIVAETAMIDGDYQLVSGTFTPSTSGVYYVGINGTLNFSPWYISIDDISIYETPDCLAPTDFIASDITESSVELNWIENNSATAWNIEYGVQGFTQGNGTVVSVSTNPYILTGLTDNTSYDIYVQSDCGGDESFWAGPISITTTQTAVSLPYTDDFSSNNWVVGNGTQTNQWHVGGAEGNPANSLYITNDGGTTNEYSHTTSVVHASKLFTLPAGSNPFNFSFQWKAGGESSSDYMRVWVIPATENPTPGTLITTADITGAVMLSPQYLNLETIWQTENYEIASSYAGTDVKIVFEWRNDGFSGTTTGAAVDNISFTEITCPAPTSLLVDNFDVSTADISWTAGDSETDWNVSWGAPGYTPGDGDEVGNASVTSPSYQITGLTENTYYDIYVQADCGSGDESMWVGPLTIYTGYCVPTSTGNTTRYIDGVVTQGALMNINNTGTGLSPDAYGDYTGTDTLRVYPGQEISVEFTHPSTTYHYKIWVDWDSDLDFDGSNDLIYATTSYQSSPHLVDITIPALTPEGVYRMRVRNSSTTLGGPCGNNASSETEDYILHIVSPPSCLPVSDIATTSATFQTSTITWTANNSETSWNISWGNPGYTPGDGDELGTDVSTSTTYQITGLTEDTHYDVYVQADCGGDESNWVGPLSVYTGYCVPTSTGNTTRYIDGVVTQGALMNINNTGTGLSPDAYGDYTGTDTLRVYPGQEISVEFTHPSTTYHYKIWVDWDSDLDFDGSNDLIYATTSYQLSPHLVDITIPALTPEGVYRMRVRNSSTTLGGPCGNNASSETEDYILHVVAPPSCLPVSDIATTSATFQTSTITWTANNSETSWNISWGNPGYTPGDGDELGTDVSTSTTYQITGLTGDTHYDVYVQADCGGGDESIWAGPYTIFTGYCEVSTTSTADYLSSVVSEDALTDISYSATTQPAGSDRKSTRLNSSHVRISYAVFCLKKKKKKK